jgi:electron transfer flavoprotein alpha subunit
MIVVIAEQQNGRLNRASIESVAAAARLDREITVVVAGADTLPAADELSRLAVSEVVRLEHESLRAYTPDAMVAALAGFLRDTPASHVLLPHTYQTRDFAPRLAARLGRALATDCIGADPHDGTWTFTRSMFQGKVTARVALDGPAPHFVTFQIGAYRADDAPVADSPAPVRVVAADIAASDIRQQPEAPFRESRQTIDLTQAERIVAAGRGIKEEAHLSLVRQLASALDAEVAASRPICDAGWLPMDRQIGSSGQTVAPLLYVAVGISGAIQHIVGMKGAKTIVAINKDADAPIFEVADYGIVGDLFEIVPALVAALDAR